MGLKLHKTLPNGVQLNYFRVTDVHIITNVGNCVRVAGYTSKAKRQEEADAMMGDGTMDVYVEGFGYECPYDQTMTIDSAYAYLKTLPDYEGAEDVLEDEQAVIAGENAGE